MSESLTRAQASAGAPQWRLLLGRLHRTLEFPTFVAAVDFVDRVARVAEEQQHHPEIDLRYNVVHLATSSHDVGGLTRRDLALCAAVDVLADAAGAVERPERLTEVEIAIDTMDAAAIRPFWAAVLGYPDSGDDLVDPQRIGPSVWFQQLGEPRPVRNRIHLDVTVAHDEAEGRIARALAAGGRLVSDAAAPRFWILADADGNEACVCTWRGRDEAEAAAEAS